MTERKLAIFFPGVGYTTDKPLLYYSRRLAAGLGYEIRLLSYGGFPRGVMGDREKMAECWRLALAQTEEELSDVDLSECGDILFVGKSIGTILAARFAAKSPAADRIRLVLYTPLEDTFSYTFGPALAFTGSADPWVGRSQSRIPALCRERNIPCTVLPGADHSLETGDPLADIGILRDVMAETERFVRGADPRA